MFKTIIALVLVGVALLSSNGASGSELQLNGEYQQYDVNDHIAYWLQSQELNIGKGYVDSIRGVDWQQFDQNVNNLGYSLDTYWYRIKVKNLLTETQWYFVVENSLIRSLDLYVVENNEMTEYFQVGDRFEFKARPIEHRKFVFPLQLMKGDSVELYFRVNSVYALQLPAYIINQRDYLKYEISESILHGLFFGFLMVMSFYNLFLFFSTKDISYFYYTCFTVSVALFQLSQQGLGYQYLWSTNIWWQHKSISISSSLAFAFGALFVQSFLRADNRLPKVNMALRCMWMSALLVLVISMWGDEYYSQQITVYFGMLGALLVFGVGVLAWRSGVKEARFLVMAWGVFLITVIAFGANKLGLLPRNQFTEYGLQFGTAIELSLLSFALADRINAARKEQDVLLEQSRELERSAKLANEKVIEAERVNTERLERNVKSRTDQLQAVLKELSDANSQLEEMSAIDSLTGVRSFAYFSEKVIEEWERASRESNWLSLIIVSVDQFELIGDRYGYVAAEEILKNISNFLTDSVARPADVIGRVASAEFGVLMPNTDNSGAKHVAKLLFDRVASEPLNLGVCSISVTVSISVVSRLPDNQMTPEAFIELAQDRLLALIEKGGNTIS